MGGREGGGGRAVQVMLAERMKRGLKAEMEEAREILDAYVEENRALVELLAKGRGHVQQLQAAALTFTPDDADETDMATVPRLNPNPLPPSRPSPASASVPANAPSEGRMLRAAC